MYASNGASGECMHRCLRTAGRTAPPREKKITYEKLMTRKKALFGGEANSEDNTPQPIQSTKKALQNVASQQRQSTRTKPLMPPLIVVLTYDAADVSKFSSSTGIVPKVISYDHEGALQDVSQQLKQVFEESLHVNRQVLIACSSFQDKVYDIVNAALDGFFEGRPDSVRLRNVVILHWLMNVKDVIFNHDQKVRSITNVWFCLADNIEKCLKNTTLVGKMNWLDTCGIKIRSSLASNGREFSHRLSCDTFPSLYEFHVEDTWWYKLFKSVPRCAEGRLLQQAGTCWWDSIMNSLLLSQTAAELLRQKWYALDPKDQEDCKQTTLRMCPMQTMSHIKFMCVLIYHILIQGNRARFFNPQGTSWTLKEHTQSTSQSIKRDNDLSSRGARFVLYEMNKRLHKNPQEGSNVYVPENTGGYPVIAIPIMARVLFESSQCHLLTLTTRETDAINNKASFTCETEHDYEWSYFSADKWEMTRRFREFEQYPRPQMIILINIVDIIDYAPELLRAPESIKINSITYNLESGGLRFPRHAVAGFTCKDANGIPERYIFDSNNKLTADDWPTGQMAEYNQSFGQTYQANEQDGSNQQWFEGFDYLLYGSPVMESRQNAPPQSRLQSPQMTGVSYTQGNSKW